MKKLLKRIPRSATYFIPCVLIACVLLYVIILRVNAESLGTTFGQSAGYNVGKFSGSLEALGEYKKAYEEGKEEGLSAEDTVAEVVDKIKEVERLEVLVASVKLNDIHTVGDDYAALYLLKGEAVFTVDLSGAEITAETDGLHILLPQLEMDLKVDPRNIEKIAEYQRRILNGSSEGGYNAYLNSMKKIVEESKETIVNYDSLKQTAEETAIKHVTQLANSVAVEKREVIVTFIGEE